MLFLLLFCCDIQSLGIPQDSSPSNLASDKHNRGWIIRMCIALLVSVCVGGRMLCIKITMKDALSANLKLSTQLLCNALFAFPQAAVVWHNQQLEGSWRWNLAGDQALS